MPESTETLAPHQYAPHDHGRLPDDTRRVLLQLLRGPYVHHERHPALWRSLVRDETVIRERLGDLYLRLVLDHERGLAFIANADLGDIETPRVVRQSPLTLIDTALVLTLRLRLLRTTSSTGRVFIGLDEIMEELSPYRPPTNTDVSTFAKRITASVEKMKRASVLLGTNEEGRFEISPILELVFDADQVEAVTREVRALVNETTPAQRLAAADDDDEDDEPLDPTRFARPRHGADPADDEDAR